MLPSTTGGLTLDTPEELRRPIRRRAWEPVEQATLDGVASIDRRIGIRSAGEIEEQRSAWRATRAHLAGGSHHSR